MGKNVWSTLAIIVGAAPLQVSRDSGRLQYAALRVTRRGGSLSYAPGYFETAQRLPDVNSVRLLGDEPGFVPCAYVQAGALGQYTKLFTAASELEASHRAEAARLSVEAFREQGRQQTKNPVPRRSQQRKAS
jgi:hypothetical protein